MSQQYITEAVEQGGQAPAQALIPQLSLQSMFWRPKFLADSDWLVHVPAAFWLVEAHQPQRIVELGIEDGVSYFAFCQAIERLCPYAECLAFSAKEPAESLLDYNETQYQEFSQLDSATQDQALARLEEGSIDLLHITFDVAAHIAEHWDRWQKKLSPRALVLISGANASQGQAKALFERLKQTYPHFLFRQNDGLGVVGVGSHQGDTLTRLFGFKATDQASRMIQQVFKRLGLACDAGQRLAEVQRQQAADLDTRFEETAKLTELLQAEEVQAATHQRQAGNLQARLDTAQQHLQRRDAEIAALAGANDTWEQQQQSLQEAYRQLQQAHERVQQEADSRQRSLEEEKHRAQQQEKVLNQRIETLTTEHAQAQQRIDTLNAEHSQAQQGVKTLEQRLQDARQQADSLQQENAYLTQEQETRFQELAELTQMLEEKVQQLEAAQKPASDSSNQRAAKGNTAWRAIGEYLPLKGKDARRLKQQVALVRDSGLFDESWYLKRNPDVSESGIPPIVHFVRFGGAEGRSPGPHFDTQWYLNEYPDVGESGMNPLIHYLEFGKSEQRWPTPQAEQGKAYGH